MKSVLVVGGGPAGCAAGAALSARGFNVQIADLREDIRLVHREKVPTLSKPGSQRSINLALSTRGLTTLDALGCGDAARKLGVPMHGREVHSVDGCTEFQPYGQPGQYLLSVPRNELSQLLAEAAARAGCNFRFDHKCIEAQLDAGTVVFETKHGEVVTVEADLIIGADGTFSKVRSSMMRASTMNYSQDYLPIAYKELHIPSELGSSLRLEALHIWPRHMFMLIALPNLDGSFTLTLFHGRENFEALTTEKSVLDLFCTYFPDTISLIPDLISDFFSNPTPSLITVRCEPYHYRDKAVLVGDAAHAIVPFYGQGCNLALEDIRVLWELLDGQDDNLGSVLEEFTQNRKRNADTIAELAILNRHEMASKTASPIFVLRRRLLLLLNRMAPKTFVPLYTMISFSNIPYADAVMMASNTEHVIQFSLSLISVLGTASAVGVSLYLFRTRN